MLGWAMGIMVLALSSHGASALTADATGSLSGDAGAVGSPATSAIREEAPAAPAQGVQAPAAPVQRDWPSGNPLWTIPLTKLSSTRERPIFSSSRRPPAPAVAPTPVAKSLAVPKPSEPERPKFALVGTIAGSPESLGIFVDQSTNVAVRLRTGEYHQGWKLRSVQGRQAVLEKDQQAITLAFPEPGREPPSPPPSVGKRISAASPSWHDRSSH